MLAVGIPSFNRPHYLKQLIQSLEFNDTENVHFYLFQDNHTNKFSGTIKTSKDLINESIKAFTNSSLPNKHIVKQDHNVGIAINLFEAKETLSKIYKDFIIIEDDVVLSPHYLRLIKLLTKQLKNEKQFSFSLNFLRRCDPQMIESNLDKLMWTNEHWWAECYNSAKWKRVKKYFMEYYKIVKDCDYQQRPNGRIKNLFKTIGLNIPQTSQDAGMDYALKKAGLKRLNSVVNRGMYIGITGTHFKPSMAEKYKFDEQTPFYFESDLELKEFTIL